MDQTSWLPICITDNITIVKVCGVTWSAVNSHIIRMAAVMRNKIVSLAVDQPWFNTKTPDIIQPDSSSPSPITAQEKKITLHWTAIYLNEHYVAIATLSSAEYKPSPSSTTCGPTGIGIRKSKLTTSHTSVRWRPGVTTHSSPPSTGVDLQTTTCVGAASESILHQPQVAIILSCTCVFITWTSIQHPVITGDVQ